jgi:hypothetical protein
MHISCIHTIFKSSPQILPEVILLHVVSHLHVVPHKAEMFSLTFDTFLLTEAIQILQERHRISHKICL